MEPKSLETAATYVNNLLLARGLLRNGAPIDFLTLADPRASKRSPDNSVILTAQIINLIHDMVLRKDRDQEHIESLTHTVHTLRASSTTASQASERAADRTAALSRELAQTQATARTTAASLAALEASARTLREDAARARNTLKEVRAQCAADLRRRDLHIQRLKAHLSAHQRGSNGSAAAKQSAASTSRAATMPALTAPTMRITAGQQIQPQEDLPSVHEQEYSLQQETTQFLTELSASLSDENDALGALVRSTLAQLKQLLGLPHNQLDELLEAPVAEAADGLVAAPVPFDRLQGELEDVVAGLRELLTNPAFAPIEEVEARDEEIERLREAWEKMEVRWRETVLLMKSWKKRMLEGGDQIGLEELKAGLNIGEGLHLIRANANIAPVSDPTLNMSSLAEALEEGDDDEDEEIPSSPPDFGEGSSDNVHLDESLEEDELAQDSRLDDELFKVDLKATGDADAKGLREIEVNRQPQQALSSKRRVGFYNPRTKTVQVDFRDGSAQAELTTDLSQGVRPQKGYLQSTNAIRTKARQAPRVSSDAATGEPKQGSLTKGKATAHARTVSSTKPAATRKSAGTIAVPVVEIQLQEEDNEEPLQNLTVTEKLQYAEEEARRASQGPRTSSPSEVALPSVKKAEPRISNAPSLKKTRISGRPRRRKSTLSPEELEQLMGASGS